MYIENYYFIDYILNLICIYFVIKQSFNGFRYEFVKFAFNFISTVVNLYLWENNVKIVVLNCILFFIINKIGIYYATVFQFVNKNEIFLSFLFSFLNLLTYLNFINLIGLFFFQKFPFDYLNNFFVRIVMHLSVYIYKFLQ